MAAKDSNRAQRWTDILEIVCENLAPEWATFGRHLGFGREELAQIGSQLDSSIDRCWEMLLRWSARVSPGASAHALIGALNSNGYRRIGDIVSKLALHSEKSIDSVLGPHLDREVRMREAFYAVADSASQHWRHLAKKLGLSSRHIADIESCDVGRSREKCLRVLYKWRLMSPLSDYKLGTLIQALNACGLCDLAGELRPLATNSLLPKPERRKRKGEAIIHLDTELVRFKVDTSYTDAGRPKQPMPKNTLREYALSKLFVRFQDDLDLQERLGPHRLVSYFHDINQSVISEVSRQGAYIVVQCKSRDDVYEIYRRARSGELSEKVTQSLVDDAILVDLGITLLRLKADMTETELVTVRSEQDSHDTSSLHTHDGGVDIASLL